MGRREERRVEDKNWSRVESRIENRIERRIHRQQEKKTKRRRDGHETGRRGEKRAVGTEQIEGSGEDKRGNRDAELIKMCEVEGYIESFSMTCIRLCIRFSRGIGFVKLKSIY